MSWTFEKSSENLVEKRRNVQIGIKTRLTYDFDLILSFIEDRSNIFFQLDRASDQDVKCDLTKERIKVLTNFKNLKKTSAK